MFLSPRRHPHMFACAAAAKVAGATAGGANTRSDDAGFVEWKKLGGCSASGISAGGRAWGHARRRARGVEHFFVRAFCFPRRLKTAVFLLVECLSSFLDL